MGPKGDGGVSRLSNAPGSVWESSRIWLSSPVFNRQASAIWAWRAGVRLRGPSARVASGGRLGRAPDVKARGVVFLGSGQQNVALLGTEMWNVDMGGRVSGEKVHLGPCCNRSQRFAQAQDG